VELRVESLQVEDQNFGQFYNFMLHTSFACLFALFAYVHTVDLVLVEDIMQGLFQGCLTAQALGHERVEGY
jgi:hypothetical protein